MTYIKTNVEGLVRDGSGGAILNTDTEAYRAYKERRRNITEHERLKSEVSRLKGDICELKALIERILREQTK